MKWFFRHRYLYLSLLLLAIGVGIYFYISGKTDTSNQIIGTVDTGPVREVIGVSGSIKAENTAELGFLSGGTVATVHVRKGDVVATGSPLISLDIASLEAAVTDAEAILAAARADYAALVAGARSETRTVSQATVDLRTEALERIKVTEAQKVSNALRTLRSSNLTAYSDDDEENATAPVISGTYTCDTEGTYTLSLYSSGADSGYSFRLSGLESGTFPVSTDQAIAFGTCGLRAQFSPNARYGDSIWYVDIPNQKSSTYIANRNAYELALSQQKSAVAQAEQELTIAQADAKNIGAPARSEALARASAVIAQAEARLTQARITATDATIRAPFTGTITEVRAIAGESVTATPLVTLVASDRFELTARLAEIDVSKVVIGQNADVTFDTAPDSPLVATVDYISPTATIIDGVAYYEARLNLASTPTWLRGGLNADIDIITKEATGTRIPKRFITETNSVFTVQRAEPDASFATTTIEVVLMGNDGFAAVTGLEIGDTVLAP